MIAIPIMYLSIIKTQLNYRFIIRLQLNYIQIVGHYLMGRHIFYLTTIMQTT